MSESGGIGPLSQADIDAALAGSVLDTTAKSDGGAVAVSEAAPPAVTTGEANAPARAQAGDGRVDAAGKPFDAAAAEMAAAIEAERAAAATPSPAKGDPQPVPTGAAPLRLPDLTVTEDQPAAAEQGIDLLRDVSLHVKIELGRSRMLVEDVLRLAPGAVVELDKLAGDPVDVLVNERLVARGEVLVLNDNFCVRINEILSGLEDVT